MCHNKRSNLIDPTFSSLWAAVGIVSAEKMRLSIISNYGIAILRNHNGKILVPPTDELVLLIWGTCSSHGEPKWDCILAWVGIDELNSQFVTPDAGFPTVCFQSRTYCVLAYLIHDGSITYNLLYFENVILYLVGLSSVYRDIPLTTLQTN